MGVWSPTIYGNDLAEDLKGEYFVAFSYYDVDKALIEIEKYVSSQYDLSDECELCDYVYSLADFMWKKGILTEEVKQRALYLIDHNIGLEEWKQAGKGLFNARLKVLKGLKERLLSVQPSKKKISIKYYTKPIFEIGDVIAIKLKTIDKIYDPKQNKYLCDISLEEFINYHNKYVVLLKVKDCISYTSAIVPEVKDIFPHFKLYNKIFAKLPTIKELRKIDFVKIENRTINEIVKDDAFWTDGKLSYFTKRDCVILGKDERTSISSGVGSYIALGMNKAFGNADSELIAFIDKNKKGRIF